MSSSSHNPSSASSILSVRQHGVCTGHLWKHSIPTKKSTKKKEFVYCVLQGVTLSTFCDYNAYMRGDHAMSLVTIVGASAWNDHSTTQKGEKKTTSTTNNDTSFRMVTAQGTHIYCTAPASTDRNLWLASLHAGLEASFSTNKTKQEETTLPPFMPPSPRVRGSKRSYCKSCGKLAYQGIVLEGAPLPQYGCESQQLICPLCSLAQGVFLDVQRINNLYHTLRFEKATLEEAHQKCVELVQQHQQQEHSINPIDKVTEQLLLLLKSPTFARWRRVSPVLEEQCVKLTTHDCIIASEFLESLQHYYSKEDEQVGELKKQALTVAGDMGSAMRLLQTCCSSSSSETNSEMLSYILDFFLDLCQEGELSSVAFFWPQLQCIHLRMLPPENALELQKVELFEDFLLTVSIKYSVQLALELVWGYSADLEDSLYNPNCLPAGRRRRFSVLRFVCELESLLFDFEHGWGGGSVALKNMIQPSPHQVTLLRFNMLQLQRVRQEEGLPFLSQSVRRDKLFNSKFDLPPEEAAQEALRIARNADYFSSHLSYIRRLGDVAEKLFHLELEARAPTLERELSLLNSSGGMGGDPLNRIHENLIRVIGVPQKEGHVFRSKERTPVLLLMELLEEGVVVDDMSTPSLSPEKKEPMESATSACVEGVQSSQDVAAVANDEEESDGSESEQAKGEGTGEAECAHTGDKAEDSSDESDESESVEGSDDQETKANDGGDLQTEKGVDDGDNGNGDESETSAKAAVKHDSDIVDDKDIYSDPLKSLDAELTDMHHHSPRALGKLKHFDTPQSEHPSTTPSKKRVEEMIGQLDMPSLAHAKDDGDEQSSTADDDANEEEDDDADNKGDESIQMSRLNSALSGSRRMSAFGSDAGDSTRSLPGDEIRREVLTAIMMKGKRGANAIASMSAVAALKSLQDLDRKRAVDMILHGDEEESSSPRYVPPGSERKFEETEAARQKLLELGLDQASIAETLEAEPGVAMPSEEDEAMEALRLLLLQNRVGQGTMSAESAAMAMAQPSASSVINVSGQRDHDVRGDRTGKVDKSELIEIDAGDVDPRLSGCGALPPAVLSALTLWKAEVVTTGELLELVKKDLDYIRLIDEDNADKLIENSQFWGRFAYGERWAEKKARLAASSPNGTDPGWDLVGVIVKANDDLRQEAFVMQLIELCDEAFQLAGLELWLHPYRILATGRTTGIIEMVKNAMSFDALKKRPGYGRGGLREHLKRMTEFTADPGEAFRCAQRNFVSSLAAYSLLSYFFLFKDRHNGNILLDTVGHVIHIDFGFVFGIAPGGSFSLEMSTPFKLTEEMMEVMGGMESPLFSEFVTLFCCGFLALQAHVDTFATVVEITCRGSSFKCFEGKDADEVVTKLRERFVPDLSKEATVAYALDLIKQATKSYGTKQYDYFQYLSQGIAA